MELQSVSNVESDVFFTSLLTQPCKRWVSYDDAQTFNIKKGYANSHCIGGTMAWAVDLDSDNNSAIDGLNTGNNTISDTAVIRVATGSYNAATLGIFWTPCLPPGSQVCPQGYTLLTTGHGKVFDADLNHLSGEGCHGGGNGFNRALCAPSGLYFGTCSWGRHNAGLCNSKVSLYLIKPSYV
jgi:chitinase